MKISSIKALSALARNVRVLFVLSAIFAGYAVAAKPLVIGFSQEGAESSWRTAEKDSIKSEAAARGVTLKFSDAQSKQENQIRALRAFIAQGVDGIILAPIVETGWEPVLREAK